MPNTREKLIELLKEADRCEFEEQKKSGTFSMEAGWKLIADHLIANGVTIQKWIPVTERLPEDDSDVLAYLRIGEEGRIYPANYAKGVWFDCIFNTPATDTTTHWMPLPKPPKGE